MLPVSKQVQTVHFVIETDKEMSLKRTSMAQHCTFDVKKRHATCGLGVVVSTFSEACFALNRSVSKGKCDCLARYPSNLTAG